MDKLMDFVEKYRFGAKDLNTFYNANTRSFIFNASINAQILSSFSADFDIGFHTGNDVWVAHITRHLKKTQTEWWIKDEKMKVK